MKMLGLTLWPEKLSDEQYVERTRKGLRVMRRWRYITGGMGLCFLGVMIWFCLRAVDFLSDLNNMTRATGHDAPTVQQQLVYGVYLNAILLGFLFGFMFYNAVFHIASALFEYRKDKLLVECWDALSDAEKARLRQRSS